MTREEWDTTVADMVATDPSRPYGSIAAGVALTLLGYVQAGDKTPAIRPVERSYQTNGITYTVGVDGVTRMATKKSSKKAPPKERPLPPWLNKPVKKGGKKK